MAKTRKNSDKLRLAVCGLYVAQIFFLTCGYFQYNIKGNDSTVFFSCFTIIYNAIAAANVQVAIMSIILAVIPIAGFFIFAFDKKRNFKNIYGILTSVICVFLILNLTELSLGWGSTLSLICYLPIVFLCVMGLFASAIEKR